MANRFEDLVVWKRAARLSSELYKTLRHRRDYGFRDQLTRAGLSIPSNIAEGFERESHRECASFLSIAKGSCGEVRTQIYIGIDIGYIDKAIGQRWISETKKISAMLAAFIKARRRYAAERRAP